MNRHSISLVCLLLLAVLAFSANAEIRIVGGETTTIDKLPYLVQLRTTKGFFFCGGTLVAPTYVISAAHCLTDKTPSDIIVVGGATYIHNMGVQRTIAQTFVPEKYDITNPKSVDDIVVFRLRSPMEGKNIQPIGLCSADTDLLKGDGLVQISGWGAMYQGSAVSDQVRTERVPLVHRERCEQLYSNFAKIYGSMFCAAELGSQDSCQGDSGGPAVLGGELCGVVSWGRGCAGADSPGIYTSINHMRPFIDASMGIKA